MSLGSQGSVRLTVYDSTSNLVIQENTEKAIENSIRTVQADSRRIK